MNHIVIDLEMNKIVKQIRGDSKLSSELIEIGAVKMDDHFQVIDTYKSYVSPDYGKMDKKIIELTGITVFHHGCLFLCTGKRTIGI